VNVLVLTDLDSVGKAPGGAGGSKSVPPKRGDGQTTSNGALKSWHPKRVNIDDLLNVTGEDLAANEGGHHLRMAFQQEVEVDGKTHIPRTFEDALILQNMDFTAKVEGAVGRKIKAITDGDGRDLDQDLFDLVRSATKANFALDCLLMAKEGGDLKPPAYMADGLRWLEDLLSQNEVSARLAKKEHDHE